MAKKVIIGVHGLGNKPPKTLLAKWWKKSMIEGLSTNGFAPALPKFEMVYWADLFYDQPFDISEKDNESEYYLNERYVAANPDFKSEDHSTRQKIVDFLDHQLNKIFLNKDYSLNYTVITDAIISKFFKELDIYYKEDCILENASLCKKKESINNRLIELLNKYNNHEIMIIGHSMGSIIGYDVLRFSNIRSKIDYFITLGSPLGLPVVRSKIAAEQRQSDKEAYQVLTPDIVTKNWFNFSDILDRVAFNYQLADDFAKNSNGVGPVDFLVINNYEYMGRTNPHKSYGYLRTPEFSKVLNSFITDKISIRQKVMCETTRIINWLSRR